MFGDDATQVGESNPHFLQRACATDLYYTLETVNIHQNESLPATAKAVQEATR